MCLTGCFYSGVASVAGVSLVTDTFKAKRLMFQEYQEYQEYQVCQVCQVFHLYRIRLR